MIERGRHRAGDAALHVHRAAAVELRSGDFAGERRMLPRRLVSGRHHVGMAGERQMRPLRADARVQILDIVGAGFRKHHPMHGETGLLQDRLEIGERAAFRRRHRRTTDELARESYGVNGQLNPSAAR